jgi:hypothetical protein
VSLGLLEFSGFCGKPVAILFNIEGVLFASLTSAALVVIPCAAVVAFWVWAATAASAFTFISLTAAPKESVLEAAVAASFLAVSVEADASFLVDAAAFSPYAAAGAETLNAFAEDAIAAAQTQSNKNFFIIISFKI